MLKFLMIVLQLGSAHADFSPEQARSLLSESQNSKRMVHPRRFLLRSPVFRTAVEQKNPPSWDEMLTEVSRLPGSDALLELLMKFNAETFEEVRISTLFNVELMHTKELGFVVLELLDGVYSLTCAGKSMMSLARDGAVNQNIIPEEMRGFLDDPEEDAVREKKKIEAERDEKLAALNKIEKEINKASESKARVLQLRVTRLNGEVDQLKSKLLKFQKKEKEYSALEKISFLLRRGTVSLNFDNVFKVIQFAGEGLFLKREDFKDFDQELLEKEVSYGKTYDWTASRNLNEHQTGLLSIFGTLTPYGSKMTAKHFETNSEYVYKLFRLLELELERRKHSAYQEQGEVREEIPEVLEEMHMSKSKTPVPAATIEKVKESKSLWNVEIKKYVQDASLELMESQGLSFKALMALLKDQGPVLNPQDARENRLRNFGKLTEKDYHCHLGSSDTVVVWRVLGPNQLSIYYLGRHPNNYKAILKKNIIPAAAEKP